MRLCEPSARIGADPSVRQRGRLLLGRAGGAAKNQQFRQIVRPDSSQVLDRSAAELSPGRVGWALFARPARCHPALQPSSHPHGAGIKPNRHTRPDHSRQRAAEIAPTARAANCVSRPMDGRPAGAALLGAYKMGRRRREWRPQSSGVGRAPPRQSGGRARSFTGEIGADDE